MRSSSISVLLLVMCSPLTSAMALDPDLSLDQGAYSIEGRSTFELLSDSSTFPGMRILREVKFTISDICSDSPSLYFMNTTSYPSHYTFCTEVLDWSMSLYEFNLHTYYSLNRKILAGSILLHDGNQDDTLSDVFYTLEFWPIDPVYFEEVELSYKLITDAMYCPSDMVFYHPVGQNQINIYRQQIELFQDAGIPVILTDSLYRNLSYIPLNLGEAYGILRGPEYTGTLSFRDVVVFQNTPNTLSHVAGIITTFPQTPLSHINLKAKQNRTPNAYIPGFFEESSYTDLFDFYVRLEVRSNGFELDEATVDDFNLFYESTRPENVTYPVRDLSATAILSLDDLRFRDSNSVGAKAANVAELRRCLPSYAVPEGVAVPFFYYDEFMKLNGLYEVLNGMIGSASFTEDPHYRQQALADFRVLIESSDFPEWMMDSLGKITAQFPPGTSLRCRSSTNSEDQPCFNGAGLYDSYTHHTYEGHIAVTIRQVWASLWTYRAFEERQFHRIDHTSTAMGVLVHPSYKSEHANGVAVTVNVFDPHEEGFYVNAQVGDDLVTNPEECSVPDEFITIHRSPLGDEIREIQYISFSNRTSPGESVLDETQVNLLIEYLRLIHLHFTSLYRISLEDNEFAMEIEFKISSDGELIVKQARPWIN